MTVKISVPASSANLGPGFDSLGLAVDRYLTLEIVASDVATWHVEHELGQDVPHDRQNLIVQAALAVDPTLTPKHVKVSSEIPLARGLGSSSAAIVAGVKLAQYFSKKTFSDQDLLTVATAIEGHPDNVAPALFGNLTISVMLNEQPKTITADFPDIELVAYIPTYELATKDSRSVLPAELSYQTAVRAGSIGNALVAALLTKDRALLTELLELDVYHEPYRQKLVPHLPTLRQLGQKLGAIGTYLSGAGPTVMTLLTKDKLEPFINQAKAKGLTGEFVRLHVDRLGATVSEN